MTSISEFRRALATVPSVLLSPDDQRVLTDARTSLDILERIDVVPRSVVVAGASGSGKSVLVNALAGDDVAAAGVTRPTTTRVTMYGGSGPVSLSAESDYVHVPGMRPGLVIIDTPPWEHDPDGVRSAVAVADVVVVVVTPSRYSDASIHDLIVELPNGRATTVVLNRIAVAEPDRSALVESVRSRYDADIVEVDEGGDLTPIASDIVDMLPVDTDGYERAAILRAAAAAAGRHLAGVTAAGSTDVGSVARAIDTVTPHGLPATHTVVEEWPTTRTELVREVEAARRALDDDVVRIADSDLAVRLRSSLPGSEPGMVAVELDGWRTRCIEAFTASARIRWRRSAAVALIERFSWKLALNPSVQVPPRMRRIMGSRLEVTRRDAADDLSSVLAGAVSSRRGEWRSVTDALGSFAPGALLSVADGFSRPPT